jgi:hypothetical protein
LPKHIDAQKVIEAVSPNKDVDGFHIASAGALMTGMPGFWPCTPYGCMKMLESIHYDLRGKHAVVIGRSNIVGKPMAMMLLPSEQFQSGLDVFGHYILGIADGPTEVHKVTVAKQVLKDYQPDNDLFPNYHIPRLRDAAKEQYATELAELKAEYEKRGAAKAEA